MKIKRALITVLLVVIALMLVGCGKKKKHKKDLFSDNEESQDEEGGLFGGFGGFGGSDEEEEVTEIAVVTTEATTEVTTETTTEATPQAVEYSLNRVLFSGFSNGIAVVSTKIDSKNVNVVIDKNLQVIYSGDETVNAVDALNGRVIFKKKDQEKDPGFYVVDAKGKVVYQSAEKVAVINFTKDGNIVYQPYEKGMTEVKYYFAALDSKYKEIAKVEVDRQYDDSLEFFNVSEGTYMLCSESGTMVAFFNTKTKAAFNLKDEGIYNTRLDSSYYYYIDGDGCLAYVFSFKKDSKNDHKGYVTLTGLDCSKVSDIDALVDIFDNNAKPYDDSLYLKMSNHKLVEYKMGTDDKANQIVAIEGFNVPDLGAPITKFVTSSDGKYCALGIRGVDGKEYRTVITTDGKILYDPVQYDTTIEGVVEGNIFGSGSDIITADGTVMTFDEGIKLSGVTKDTVSNVVFYDSSSRVDISDGYIFKYGSLYSLDGTRIETVYGK